MFKALTTAAVAASSIFLIAPAAQADLITFEFGAAGNGAFVFSGENRAYRDTLSGVTLTVRGFEIDTPTTFNNNTPGSSVLGESFDREPVTRDTSGTNQGLGLNSDGDQFNSQLDGNDGGSDDVEVLRFTLTDAMGDEIEVQLREIVFNNADSDDDFGLANFSTVLLTDESIAPASGSSFAYDFTSFDFVSANFGVFADSGTAGDGENFKIRSFTVAQVPEPATLGLLGAGLLGLAGMNRRKK